MELVYSITVGLVRCYTSVQITSLSFSVRAIPWPRCLSKTRSKSRATWRRSQPFATGRSPNRFPSGGVSTGLGSHRKLGVRPTVLSSSKGGRNWWSRSSAMRRSQHVDVDHRCRTQGTEAPGPADWETVCAKVRKSASHGVSGVSGNRLRAPGPLLPRLTSRSAAGRPLAEVPLAGLSFTVWGIFPFFAKT